MKKIYLAIALLLILGAAASAQSFRFVIAFSDKKGSPYTLDNPAAYLSGRAIQRRIKQKLKIDSTDLPVNPAYIDSIKTIPSVTVLNVSKWMNQVLIRTDDSSAIEKIAAFPFVVTARFIAPNSIPGRSRLSTAKFNSAIQGRSDFCPAYVVSNPNASANYYNYGTTYPQIHIHNGEYLHNLGFHGEGMQVALLDAGFYSYLSNPAFDSLLLQNHVLGTYDYVNQKESVNEENAHGSFCLSVMAANEPGTMVGTAPAAAYWLFKTEDVNSEYPVEEQNWVAAAEFADSAGADLLSTSLGYAYFDDPAFDLDYPQRNGHTSLISVAANMAVAKGMILTVSAGNSGDALDDRKYILCPADADSVLAVGAIDISGTIASFSSWGPNSSGEVKPNVVSVGQDITFSDIDGNPNSGNGTSFSNPNLAGLIACLWQAFPEFTNHDIADAVQKSADRYTHPDARFGYGIPDFEKAFSILGTKRAQSMLVSGDNWMAAFPVPFTDNFSLMVRPNTTGTASLQLLDAIGRIVETKTLSVTSGDLYTLNFSRTPGLPRGVYFVRYSDASRSKTVRVIRL